MKASEITEGMSFWYGGKKVKAKKVKKDKLMVLVDYGSTASSGTLLLKPSEIVRVSE